MNEDDRNAHRCQNRDQVRAHRQIHREGVIDPMTQTGPISITVENHPNHEGVMNVGDGLHTKSNVFVVSHEDEVAIHKKFRERIDKLGHIQMCHVCEESYLGIQVVNTDTGPMCTRCKKEGNRHRFSSGNHMNPGLQPLVLESLT